MGDSAFHCRGDDFIPPGCVRGIRQGHAADDAVVVKFTGDHKMTDISIKEEAVDPDDVDMLQDLVLMAVNDAMNKIDKQTQETMGKYSRNIPGL